MTRKMAVIAIEFDDDEENYENASDLAEFVESHLSGLNKINVNVYATPEALVEDSRDGFGIYAYDRENSATPIGFVAETDYSNASRKP